MKKYTKIIMVAMMVMGSFNQVQAQQEKGEKKPRSEMTMEEWRQQYDDLYSKIDGTKTGKRRKPNAYDRWRHMLLEDLVTMEQDNRNIKQYNIALRLHVETFLNEERKTKNIIMQQEKRIKGLEARIARMERILNGR